MDRVLYVSMDGARQTLLAQAANSNNLANINTTGFQADLMASEDWPVGGPGHDSRVHGRLVTAGFNPMPGSLVSTGRDLDTAIVGPGWFAVQAFDGSEGYTRAGDMRVTNGGILVNGQGHQMLGDDGPISVPPADAIEISRNGTISVRPTGSDQLVTVGRLKLVNPPAANMEKGADGLLRTKDESPLEADASVRLEAGAIERSNVNAVESLVNMIEMARLFETQVQLMQTADENASATNTMLRLRG